MFIIYYKKTFTTSPHYYPQNVKNSFFFFQNTLYIKVFLSIKHVHQKPAYLQHLPIYKTYHLFYFHVFFTYNLYFTLYSYFTLHLCFTYTSASLFIFFPLAPLFHPYSTFHFLISCMINNNHCIVTI